MAAQRIERDQVGNDHERIDQVSALPDQIHRNDGAEINHQNINQFIIRNTFISYKVFRCLFTEVGPADQSSDREGRQRDGQKGITHVGKMFKGCGSQSGRGSTLHGGRVIEHVGDYDKSRDEAHDNGIPENSSHRNVGLLFRVVYTGGCRGDRRGADTCFVGKKTSGNTITQGKLQGRTYKAAGYGREGKGIFQDPQTGMRQLPVIKAEQKKAAEQIDKTHGRNDAFTEVSDFFDTAEDHCAGQYRERNADQVRRYGKRSGSSLDDGVGLGGTAYAEGSDQGADGIERAKGIVM